MKPLILLSFAWLCLLSGMNSCQSFGKFKKKSENSTSGVVQESMDSAGEAINEDREGSNEMAPTDIVRPEASDSLFFTFERTPCFGRCPIFKIRLYDSGYVTYEGINFVDNMGFYDSRVDESVREKILARMNEIGFFNMEDTYDDKMLSDLPSVKYFVNNDGVQKRILSRYQAPEELVEFGRFIENMFDDMDWTPVTHDY